MRFAQRLTTNGRITIPKPVRDALGLVPGDRVMFHVEDGVATVRRVGLLQLAGTVPTPAHVGHRPWSDVRRAARAARRDARSPGGPRHG